MRFLLFGMGKKYIKRRAYLAENFVDTFVGFLDNRSDSLSLFDGARVYSPNGICAIEYDIIIIMSVAVDEMVSQLHDNEVSDEKIWLWDDYYRYWETKKNSYKLQLFEGDAYFRCKFENASRGIIIISDDLNYNGGCLAAVYASMSLIDRGYRVFLCSRYVDEKLIGDIIDFGVTVIVYPRLQDDFFDGCDWIDQFDGVLVNTLLMMGVVSRLSWRRNVSWWIHESSIFYCLPFVSTIQMAGSINWKNTNIYAVSDIPKSCFNEYFGNFVSAILPYGIPDNRGSKSQKQNTKERVVFALIGTVCPRKAQDLFIEAIKEIDINTRTQCEFLIIGSIGEDEYDRSVFELANGIECISIMGNLTREQMKEAFCKIDVVVCCSREDPLPIVVTEGLMYEKLCIISDVIGNTEYLHNGEDSIWFKNNDKTDLANKIKWVLNNRSEAGRIGRNGRLIYEKSFTLEAFGERLEKELKL